MGKRKKKLGWVYEGRPCKVCGKRLPLPVRGTPETACWDCYNRVPYTLRFIPQARCLETYDITSATAVVLWVKQGYACGCCGSQSVKREDWRIDHVDTLSGPVVRGIICNGCNSSLLGKNGDTPAGLLQALAGADEWGELTYYQQGLDYLEKSRKRVLLANGGTDRKPGKGRVYGGNGYPFKWVVNTDGYKSGFRPSWAYRFNCDRDGRPLGKISQPIHPPVH